MQHLDEGILQAWLDRARSGLDRSKTAEIERHLAACDACAARAEALAASNFRAHGLLSLGRDQYAPRVSYEDVAKRAQVSRTPVRTRLRRVRGTWAASIIGALAVGWMSNDLVEARAAADEQVLEVVPVDAPATPATELAQTPVAETAPAAVASSETGVSVAAAPTSTQGTALTNARSSAPATSVVAVPAALTSAAASMSDPNGLVVRGSVEDEGGRPVPSAQVFVAALEVGVLTQPDGRYDLRLPAEADSFEVTVQRIGFRQQTRAISGREGDYVDADFRLREEALALDEIVVMGESDGGQTRSANLMTRRATPFVWRPLPSIAAEGYVGSDLWTLPDLDVLTLDIAYGDNPNETHVARVRQNLGGGLTLTIVQGRTDGRRATWPIQSEGAVLSTWRGEMLITATAPVATDSLRVLLGQLR
jgi:hypothetical protein